MSTERHPVHLFLSEAEVALLFNLFEERIKRHKASIKKELDFPNERRIKHKEKLAELEDKINQIEQLSALISEEAAW
ncbi:MAG: hypothetical protein ACOYN4_00405 [Bacteroidales bacterium]